MTYFQEAVNEYTEAEAGWPVMAVVDEFGRETPITELDIRRSLKLMSDEKSEASYEKAIGVLMERVEAARAIS
ncbi:MAG: hypothetical protein OEY29_00520 [Gammaproteobacteria bacterium]|nr:hypothetical protein [Gammaproteobacteria bacterium]